MHDYRPDAVGSRQSPLHPESISRPADAPRKAPFNADIRWRLKRRYDQHGEQQENSRRQQERIPEGQSHSQENQGQPRPCHQGMGEQSTPSVRPDPSAVGPVQQFRR